MPNHFVWTPPYVWSLVLLVLGVVLLLAFLIKSLRVLRRTLSVQRSALTDVKERTGLLKARIAGLRVAVTERKNGAA